jgi:predicted PolB exonuclease-like 3'-5' exonuclease
LHYYYYPESIVTAGTSWLGDNFDSVLLYGSLLEAATYMKSDADTIKNYTDRYNEALLLAKRLGDGMDRSDAYRSGQFRMPNLPQNNGVR